ncbi:ABC transporter ATP-binding protein [Pedobacter sp. HDW13]|uniref:ABC transporter ATP-binding protein n=1 Tax=unclassified Pedobacter TaxID=2628915 RepID=UPI000F5ADD87|nr:MULTISPECIES: ABC transporter ATP-binding protein [unclassified Pedobacter]QIL38053.1 ABC transporter ATP-binding protein [Pedobacter sp. HDW13]RQO69026.1 ABC transporter ATP-binding protein [Pedobacter sp. KBW01]
MEKPKAVKKPSIFSLLGNYRGLILMLILFALLSNGINLLLPKIIAHGIDAYTNNTFHLQPILIQFAGAIVLVFIFTYLQSIVQTYASERVARDLRTKLSDQISRQSHAYIIQANPSKLLTNLTADADSIKMFVSQAIVSICSSIFLIVGASILLLIINWKLALCVIAIVPIIGGAFFFVLSKVRVLFKKSREVIDWLNKVISESILGSALIRVINSQQLEYNKFLDANAKARDLGLSILRLFAGLIPIIIFVSNLSGLCILVLGGHFVITGSMSLGEFAAFSSYLSLIIFPILVIGFMSNVIAQATASYQRIETVLNAAEINHPGTLTTTLSGEVEGKNITLNFGQKPILKSVSFSAKAGSKTAIIGPTAAGKTQLLYILTGLIEPGSGEVLFDGHEIKNYNQEEFHKQVGFVFQDSIMFNMSIRENIAFSDTVTDEFLAKAIATAELKDFVEALPDQLNTIISERGSSLSGGQKQRIMLARALALNPKVLLLDDFTARVDTNTEKRILENIQQNYPGLTLISVTQKIASVEHYDKVILLMQGEIIAEGTHQELLKSSPEYVQIYNSQQSTSNYELQS